MTDHSARLIADFDIKTLKIEEPLAESAMLARNWSNSLCDSCASYHGAWQILRVLGVLNSMRSDDDFLISQLNLAIGNGARKILISGAADYALQARIAAVANRHEVSPEITVVDLCKTPLKLNRWYAKHHEMKLKVVHENILKYRQTGYFDLVCTHSFLPFFSPENRVELLKTWWDCLAPGGAVLTAQRVRPNDDSDRHGFSEQQTEAFGQRAYDLARAQYAQLNIEPQQARQLALGYARGRSTYVIRDKNQLTHLFLQQGFELEQFAAPGDGQLHKDLPSTPTQSGHHRMRILARKPIH
jgi:SAM-dependent methyltransferase